jgi:hypothetical protein
VINQRYLIYEDPAPYSWWFKFLLLGILLLTLILGIVFIPEDIAAAAVMFGVTVMDGLIFHLVMPRRYQIYTDRLVVVLGHPLSKTIKLTDIKSVKRVSGSSTMNSSGFRFTTIARNAIEIERYSGLKIVISPENNAIFLEHLEQAVKASQRYQTLSEPRN